MKKQLIPLAAIFLWSCGGANDGNASTDTTTMPVDTAMQNNIGMDTAKQVNSNTGVYPADTANNGARPAPGSRGTSPDSRTTTPRNDAGAADGGRQ